jgi:hypothetical protein
MALERKTPLKRGGRLKPVNRKRRTSEFARCYHSKERVAFVKSLPCACCTDRLTGCDNAHTRNGGAGRKGDYTTIVPLCRGARGCHRLHHDHGWSRLDVLRKTIGLPPVDWEREAARTQDLWEARGGEED